MKIKRGESVNSSSMNKVLLKQSYIKKLNITLTEDHILEKEAYNLIRNFFKEYLNLDYEFTNEEMKKELKQVYLPIELKERISKLFDSLSKIEYLSQSLSQFKLKNILINFKSIINDLVVVHYQQELPFIQKMQHSFQTFLISKRNLIKNKLINKNSIKNKTQIETKEQETNISLSRGDMKFQEPQKEKIEQPLIGIPTSIEESKEYVQTKRIEISDESFQEKKLATKIKSKKIKEKKNNTIKKKIVKKTPKNNWQKKLLKTKKQISNKIKVKIPVKINKLNIEDKIDNNLKKLNLVINKDFNKAKLLYFATLKLYNSLEDTKKDKHFEEIQKAYTRLQSKSK